MLRSPSIRSHFALLAQGISRYNISKNKVMQMKLTLPKSDEQKKIGQLFKNIDELLALHQRK